MCNSSDGLRAYPSLSTTTHTLLQTWVLAALRYPACTSTACLSLKARKPDATTFRRSWPGESSGGSSWQGEWP